METKLDEKLIQEHGGEVRTDRLVIKVEREVDLRYPEDRRLYCKSVTLVDDENLLDVLELIESRQEIIGIRPVEAHLEDPTAR